MIVILMIIVIVIVVVMIITIIIMIIVVPPNIADFGRGDDTVGIPRRAQLTRFELFELRFLDSSCSS